MFKMLFLMVLVLFSLKAYSAYSVECEKLFSPPEELVKRMHNIESKLQDILGKTLPSGAGFIVNNIMKGRDLYTDSNKLFEGDNIAFLMNNFSVHEILLLQNLVSKNQRLDNIIYLLKPVKEQQKEISLYQATVAIVLESHIHKINSHKKVKIYDYERVIGAFKELTGTLKSPENLPLQRIKGLLFDVVNKDNRKAFLAYLKSRDRAEEEMGEGLTDSQSTALVKLQKKWSTLRISSSKLLDKNFEDDYYSTLIESGLTRHDGYILLKNGLLLSSVSFLLKKEKIVAKIEDILHRRLTPSQVQKIVGNNTTGEIYSIFRTKSSKFNNFHIMLLLNNKGFSLDEIYNLIDNGVIKSKNARERLDKLAFKVEEVKKRLNKKELSPKQIRAILIGKEIELESKDQLPLLPSFA